MEALTSEREAFEKWLAKRHGLSTERWADTGKYKYDNTNAWWECWQAAHLAQPAQAVDVGAKLLHLMLERGCSKESQTHICTLLGLVEYPHNIHPRDANDAVAYFSRALSGEKAWPVGDGKYRLLGQGDVIEPDDEFIADNAVDWVPVKSNQGAANLFVGMQYRLGTLKQARRRLPASPTPGKEGA